MIRIGASVLSSPAHRQALGLRYHLLTAIIFRRGLSLFDSFVSIRVSSYNTHQQHRTTGMLRNARRNATEQYPADRSRTLGAGNVAG